MATLIRNVGAGGSWWGPDYGNADQVPDDIAVLITNPDAWDPDMGVPPSDGGRAQLLLRLARIGYPPDAMDAVGARWDEASDEERAAFVLRSDAELSVAMKDTLPAPAPFNPDNYRPAPDRDLSALEQLTVPAGSVKDIVAWVGHGTDGWQARANAAIAAETAGDRRKGILETLTDALRDDG